MVTLRLEYKEEVEKLKVKVKTIKKILFFNWILSEYDNPALKII